MISGILRREDKKMNSEGRGDGTQLSQHPVPNGSNAKKEGQSKAS
jgi:hypothetical protein